MAKRTHRSSRLDEFSTRRYTRLLEQPRGRALVLVNAARALRAQADTAGQGLDEFAATRLRLLGRDDASDEIRLMVVRALMVIGAEDHRRILKPLAMALTPGYGASAAKRSAQ